MPDNQRCAIVWFRRGLRIDDHRALNAAVASGRPVLPLFILDPGLVDVPSVAQRRVAFLMEGLAALDRSLVRRGARLLVLRGDPVEVLGALAASGRVGELHHGAETEPWGRARDRRATETLRSAGCPVFVHEDHLVRSVGTVRSETGSAYRVFTPFKRAWSRLPFDTPVPAPEHIPLADGFDFADVPVPAMASGSLVPAGEEAGMRRWRDFLGRGIASYAMHRDFPAHGGTSGLSAHLKFGMVSVRRLVSEAFAAAGESEDGPATFLSEICWRDFYHHVLDAYPHVESGCFRPEFDALPWEGDAGLWEAWASGRTGYPVVDAAMRELVQTGSMHNRARMIVASFLTKDLLIDWRQGEAYFMRHLIDGDLAANNGGWQWAAGTGTDAQPWFRIFNPVAQGERFDPEGAYVKRWVPELAKLPSSRVHSPWKSGAAEARGLGFRPGKDYPLPVVDHAERRARALAMYKTVSRGADQ